MKSSIPAIVGKEIVHILRDKQSLFMVLTMPVLMLLLYGYAITLDMQRITIMVIDNSGTPQSRELIRHVSSTDFFRISKVDSGIHDINTLFQSRMALCVLFIPGDYAESIISGRQADLQLVIDASDPNAASFIQNYMGKVTSEEMIRRNGTEAGLFSVEPRIFYNPDMRSAPFFIPGLIALILILISALLTSIAIVREKESGTMEQLLVSPVKPSQIIIGKVLPYTLLGFVDGVVILVLGSLLFDVPIQGSFLLVACMMVIYVVTGLSLGILVSTISQSQSVAMLAAITLTILPSMLMSGFIFPISSMPRAFQYFSRIVPATYFIEIIRGIVLKGNGIAQIYRQAAVLLGIDIFLITVSIRAFRIRLE
ncbi:ABC transporter permease [Sediminispirochaeta bajacaliforniensis]|uniref:ABC transporter permease n=1 Tax=Sediminispirochaeta bajacaliforniensis TaxID=148 RepID=UPI00037D8993|nr:ABC transporter permease [Sediminispirochaeta bajacaliforniensis]